jgi:hypothetical protein
LATRRQHQGIAKRGRSPGDDLWLTPPSNSPPLSPSFTSRHRSRGPSGAASPAATTAATRRHTCDRVAFRRSDGVSAPNDVFRGSMADLSSANASRPVSRPGHARLGADVDRYSFIVVDLHHLLLAGLPAHQTPLTFSIRNRCASFQFVGYSQVLSGCLGRHGIL